MRVNGRLSEEYSIQRGVRQGSVLSLALFLFIMDPLLRQLQSTQLGLTINEFYILGDFFMQMTLELWRPVKPPCRCR